MKIAIVNRSDARGGAAVVSRRLMHALRDAGADARMLVAEKLTDDPFVRQVNTQWRFKAAFLAERAQIYAANGHDRTSLFKVDTAAFGLPLERDPWVKEADVVMLNWINQGMLSLGSIRRIAAGKRVIWTMHDLWNATGICHHPGFCDNFRNECGRCIFLGRHASDEDLSHKVWKKKRTLYRATDIRFVAVSNWLAEKCRQSTLLAGQNLSVIPNPFPMPKELTEDPMTDSGKITAVMAAARLDDDIKGFPVLIHALRNLPEDVASRLRIIFCGDIRDRYLLDNVCVDHEWLGSVPGKDMPAIYSGARMVLSPSLYETLPGTLVEGQAYGALPVAFDSGGQRDIVTDGETGILADFGADAHANIRNYAEALERAVKMLDTADRTRLGDRLRGNVEQRFSAPAVAARYLDLIASM